jgi:putative peptidoglycan lipid II flippase
VMALRGYGVGLLGLVALKVLTPGFYAKQDIRTPVRVAIVVLVLTQLLNLVFVPWIGHAGLALSIGCAALVNAGWLMIGLRQRGSWTPAPGWAGFLVRVVVATTLMGALLAWAAWHFDWVALGRQELVRAGWLAAVLGAAALVYFGALLACGLRLKSFIRRA